MTHLIDFILLIETNILQMGGKALKMVVSREVMTELLEEISTFIISPFGEPNNIYGIPIQVTEMKGNSLTIYWE